MQIISKNNLKLSVAIASCVPPLTIGSVNPDLLPRGRYISPNTDKAISSTKEYIEKAKDPVTKFLSMLSAPLMNQKSRGKRRVQKCDSGFFRKQTVAFMKLAREHRHDSEGELYELYTTVSQITKELSKSLASARRKDNRITGRSKKKQDTARILNQKLEDVAKVSKKIKVQQQVKITEKSIENLKHSVVEKLGLSNTLEAILSGCAENEKQEAAKAIINGMLANMSTQDDTKISMAYKNKVSSPREIASDISNADFQTIIQNADKYIVPYIIHSKEKSTDEITSITSTELLSWIIKIVRNYAAYRAFTDESNSSAKFSIIHKALRNAELVKNITVGNQDMKLDRISLPDEAQAAPLGVQTTHERNHLIQHVEQVHPLLFDYNDTSKRSSEAEIYIKSPDTQARVSLLEKGTDVTSPRLGHVKENIQAFMKFISRAEDITYTDLETYCNTGLHLAKAMLGLGYHRLMMLNSLIAPADLMHAKGTKMPTGTDRASKNINKGLHKANYGLEDLRPALNSIDLPATIKMIEENNGDKFDKIPEISKIKGDEKFKDYVLGALQDALSSKLKVVGNTKMCPNSSAPSDSCNPTMTTLLEFNSEDGNGGPWVLHSGSYKRIEAVDDLIEPSYFTSNKNKNDIIERTKKYISTIIDVIKAELEKDKNTHHATSSIVEAASPHVEKGLRDKFTDFRYDIGLEELKKNSTNSNAVDAVRSIIKTIQEQRKDKPNVYDNILINKDKSSVFNNAAKYIKLSDDLNTITLSYTLDISKLTTQEDIQFELQDGKARLKTGKDSISFLYKDIQLGDKKSINDLIALQHLGDSITITAKEASFESVNALEAEAEEAMSLVKRLQELEDNKNRYSKRGIQRFPRYHRHSLSAQELSSTMFNTINQMAYEDIEVMKSINAILNDPKIIENILGKTIR